MTKIYSIMPWLYNEVGHFYAYNLAVRKAAHINGWEHFALVPKSCILDLPEGWEKVLSSDSVLEKRSIFAKLLRPIGSLVPLIRFLRKLRKEKAQTVLFMEHFGLPQLAILCCATLFSKANYQVWLLHRFEPTFFKKGLYNLFHRFLNVRLGRENFKILTDSGLLAALQEKAYNKRVFVVPIPHPVMEETVPFAKKEVLCWWPGGSTRMDKGLKSVQKLAGEIMEKIIMRFQFSTDEPICIGQHLVSETETDDVQLLMANNAKSKMPPAPIRFLETNLPRKDFERWMKTVDIVLLPYLAESYQLRTSGIFVEAIVAGAIPVTMDDTWMAHELKRFQLDSLILDWEQKIYPQLQEILKDSEIRTNIEKMRSHYEKYHSIENFAETFKTIMHS